MKNIYQHEKFYLWWTNSVLHIPWWAFSPDVESTVLSCFPFVYGQSQQKYISGDRISVMWQCFPVCVSSLVRRQTLPFWIWLRKLACRVISLWRGPHGKEVRGFSSRWLVKKTGLKFDILQGTNPAKDHWSLKVNFSLVESQKGPH